MTVNFGIKPLVNLSWMTSVGTKYTAQQVDDTTDSIHDRTEPLQERLLVVLGWFVIL